MKYTYSSRIRHQATNWRVILPLLAILAVLLAAGIFMLAKQHNSTASEAPVNPDFAAPVSAAPEQIGKAYGIAAGSGLPDLSAAELENRIAAVEAIGTTWVRFDFDWSQIQPDNASDYSWETYDRLVAS